MAREVSCAVDGYAKRSLRDPDLEQSQGVRLGGLGDQAWYFVLS